MKTELVHQNVFASPNDGEALLPVRFLREAFANFNEASHKLHENHQNLLNEVSALRAQLREKDLEIKKAERLSLLGETAAAIAHEVRNPLGAIQLFLSLLKKDVEDKEGPASLINEIERSVDTINHVVSNILHFSKKSSLPLAPVNLESILREVVSSLALSMRSARADISISGSPFIMGNEIGLRQVFNNLILNAVQATRYNGLVSVSVEDGENSEAIISVKDNGPGIEHAILGTLFDPFVTNKKEGTGLGLSIVKQIVDQHNGKITASNLESGGALFQIILPRGN